MPGSCSIVIRAYNEEKHIGRLLEGIRQQTIKDVEVILVDSGSTDSTVAIAESYGAKIVRIPYLTVPVVLTGDGVFYTTYIDRLNSHCTTLRAIAESDAASPSAIAAL